MNLSLKGKKAIVCGSSQGIGEATAIKLSQQDANVILVARNEPKLKKVLKKLKLSSFQEHQYLVADFSDHKNCINQFSKFINDGQEIDILINNTGGPPPGEISDAKIQSKAF